jgi:hypothetical protein
MVVPVQNHDPSPKAFFIAQSYSAWLPPGPVLFPALLPRFIARSMLGLRELLNDRTVQGRTAKSVIVKVATMLNAFTPIVADSALAQRLGSRLREQRKWASKASRRGQAWRSPRER